MGKYNFDINEINPNTVHGMILSQISPGNSSVLECGCATGYMTKYMKEKMGCSVSIVEIDQEAIDKAKQYSVNSYCGDLDEDGWYRYYRNESLFDYILFADVLEHLRDPLTVLKKARDLLSYKGRIIFSIPNICHNDILIRMYYNHFNYSSLGLLDSTHIHFWGGNDIAAFTDEAGLEITNVQALGVPTQKTEQRYPGEIDHALLAVLKKRSFGEVYQYVITCKKAVENDG